jgi:hypothetical protein
MGRKHRPRREQLRRRRPDLENLWAAGFASAARRSGGQLIANGRIPIQAIIASIEADEATATERD